MFWINDIDKINLVGMADFLREQYNIDDKFYVVVYVPGQTTFNDISPPQTEEIKMEKKLAKMREQERLKPILGKMRMNKARGRKK